MATREDRLFGMLERTIDAAGRLAAEDDPPMLARLVDCHRRLDDAILVAVAGQRANGITWQSIGEATGTTGQASIMKWGHKLRRRAG